MKMKKEMKKVTVNYKYCYETDLQVDVGDVVNLPPTQHSKEGWVGIITSLSGSYDGVVSRIVSIKEKVV